MGKAPYCWDVVNEAVTNDGMVSVTKALGKYDRNFCIRHASLKSSSAPDNTGTFKPVVPWYPALKDYVDEAFKESTGPNGPLLICCCHNTGLLIGLRCSPSGGP